MVRIRRKLPKGAALGLNRHDELGVECDVALAEQVVEIMKREMPGVMVRIYPEVPFEVKIRVFTSWDQMRA